MTLTPHKYRIRISLTNAAFEPEPDFELARILREVADRIERYGPTTYSRTISDSNGNSVGVELIEHLET